MYGSIPLFTEFNDIKNQSSALGPFRLWKSKEKHSELIITAISMLMSKKDTLAKFYILDCRRLHGAIPIPLFSELPLPLTPTPL